MNNSPLNKYSILKSRVKNFDFRNLEKSGTERRSLDSLLLTLGSAVESEANPSEEIILKTRVLLCEVHDYLGEYEAAAALAAPGYDEFESMPSTPPSTEAEHSLSLTRVRLATAYARSLYRRYAHHEAHDILKHCRKVINQQLRSAAHPCLGSLGEIAYLVGRVARQQQRLQYAIPEFNAAMHLYDQRGTLKSATADDHAVQEGAFSAHKCGTILALGTGWSNYNTGALSRALSENLIPARALLRNTGDVLNRAYADVIYSSTRRAIEGGNDDVLGQLLKLVQSALHIFKEYGHSFYADGARMELALLELARKDFLAAERTIESVAAGDQRWACSALIIISRIARHTASDGKKAEQYATRALQIAKKHDEPLSKIDALIARSEALYQRKATPSTLDQAVRDLQTALQINRSHGTRNPKTDGMCHLHLAQHYLRHGNQYSAISHYNNWRAVASHVEHQRLQVLSRDISKKLQIDDVFVIDATKDPLTYPVQRRALQRFLVRQASAKARTEKGKAALLGVTRQGLAKWLKEESMSKQSLHDHDK